MTSIIQLLKDIIKNMATLDKVYPVGSVLAFTQNVDPNTLFHGQTWARFAKGRTLVGVNESDTTFATVGKTGGEQTHKLTTSEMPSHTHNVQGGASNGTKAGLQSYASYFSSYRTISGAAYATGGGGAHNNLQPYETVYYWKRTK